MSILRRIFPQPLSQYHPLLYHSSVFLRRQYRQLQWAYSGRRYAIQVQTTPLPHRIKKHRSLLIRQLGDTPIKWQQNKIINLKKAAPCISGIVIAPGEYFSFCKLVGLPTQARGFVEGMELSFGQARLGIGGGICQIANMIHWLVLHSPLHVIERAQHSFDPFPDQGRILPFGSGAAIFYNYIDYQFYNPTQDHFQILLSFSNKHLEGELRCSRDLNVVYHIFEQNAAILQIGNAYYRRNEIWRDTREKYKSGEILTTECMTRNFARICYVPNSVDAIYSSMTAYLQDQQNNLHNA